MSRLIVRELTCHLGQEHLYIALDRYFRLVQWLAQLGCVDIHLNFGCEAREGSPVVTRLADVQPRAQNEQHVGVLHREVAGAFADGARPAAEELVVRRDEIVRPRGNDWNAQQADDALEFRKRAAQAYAASGKE